MAYGNPVTLPFRQRCFAAPAPVSATGERPPASFATLLDKSGIGRVFAH
jgi:hypothetical protein